jgi:hypothetical protein
MKPPIPRKSARLFRVTNTLFAVGFGGVAAWLFVTSRAPIAAWILAGAAVIALIDAVLGWRKAR